MGHAKVTFRACRADARAELEEAIDRKYVHVRLAETQGGTGPGVRPGLGGADGKRGEGTIPDGESPQWKAGDGAMAAGEPAGGAPLFRIRA